MLKVAAVLLAAGASTRFGPENKLVAAIDGRPLVRIVADTLVAAGLTEIIVVTGAGADEVERALGGMQVRFVHNAQWQSGMGSSIATGISTLSAIIAGAFVVPGDMPLLTVPVLRGLVAKFKRSGGAKIVYPATSKREQRNPVLWPSQYFLQLAELRGQRGAKELLKRFANTCVAVEVDDESVFKGVDTADDLTAARANAARLRNGLR